MSAPSFTPAQIAATRLQAQVLGLQSQVGQQVTRLQGIIANGIPAQGSNAAVAAADIATALGTNLATINSILAALSGAVPA